MFGYEDELKEQMVELHSEVERLRKENVKLIKVAKAAQKYDRSRSGGHSDECEQPIKCDCGYTELLQALDELDLK
jgi:hypothetical protein